MSDEWGGPVQESVDRSGYGEHWDWRRRIEERLSAVEKPSSLNNATMTGLLRVLGNITVEGLGRFLIENGGSVQIKDGQGRELLYAGGLAETVPGVPQGYGVYLRRLDGSLALVLADNADDEQVQLLRLADRGSSTLLSEDASGSGLGYPLLPLHSWRADYRTWSGTVNGAFENLCGAEIQRASPRVYVEVMHTSDVSGTTGEIRVLVNGTVIGSPSATSFVINTTGFGPTATGVPTQGSRLSVVVQGRRTAGTGQVKAELKYATSWPS